MGAARPAARKRAQRRQRAKALWDKPAVGRAEAPAAQANHPFAEGRARAAAGKGTALAERLPPRGGGPLKSLTGPAQAVRPAYRARPIKTILRAAKKAPAPKQTAAGLHTVFPREAAPTRSRVHNKKLLSGNSALRAIAGRQRGSGACSPPYRKKRRQAAGRGGAQKRRQSARDKSRFAAALLLKIRKDMPGPEHRLFVFPHAAPGFAVDSPRAGRQPAEGRGHPRGNGFTVRVYPAWRGGPHKA